MVNHTKSKYSPPKKMGAVSTRVKKATVGWEFTGKNKKFGSWYYWMYLPTTKTSGELWPRHACLLTAL